MFDKNLTEEGIPRMLYSDMNKFFVNAQWAVGGEGTGAPIHFHNTAWSALAYGAKKWFLYPPHYKIMSNKQILHFIETDNKNYTNEFGFKPLSCVQYAGDVVIVPESWGHGVLNIQESIALATEVRNPIYRIRPGFKEVSAHLIERNVASTNKRLMKAKLRGASEHILKYQQFHS